MVVEEEGGTTAMMTAFFVHEDSSVLVPRVVPVPPLKANGYLIRVDASAVNRADTLQRRGLYPPPPGASDILGLECAGEVVAVGNGVVNALPVGTRVMALLASGGYAEYASVESPLVLPIPDNLTTEQGGAIPETWLTAFQLLHLVGRITPGDKVLIHAGGSGVGIAATQLAVAHGAEVFVTAGSEAKIANSLRLGATAGFNYKEDASWGASVREATAGKGVDVVLDPVGQSHAAQNVEALAVEGTWVVFGLMGGGGVPEGMPILREVLKKRIRVEGTTLRARSLDYKGELIRRFSEFALPKFASGEFHPQIDRVFPLADVQGAHEYMESNANIGKIVLDCQRARVDEPPPALV